MARIKDLTVTDLESRTEIRVSNSSRVRHCNLVYLYDKGEKDRNKNTFYVTPMDLFMVSNFSMSLFKMIEDTEMENDEQIVNYLQRYIEKTSRSEQPQYPLRFQINIHLNEK